MYLKFLFEKTGNNNHEKAMAGEQLRLVYNKFYKNFKEATENFEFSDLQKPQERTIIALSKKEFFRHKEQVLEKTLELKNQKSY